MTHSLLPDLVSAADTPTRVRAELAVLVVEEHALVRAALQSLISATPGFAVVAAAPCLAAALDLAGRQALDVILAGGSTVAGDEDDNLAALRAAAPDACILVLAQGDADSDQPPPAAHGCLRPDAGVEELCSKVSSLLAGRCASCMLRVACPVPALAVALSRREREVAVRVARGMSSKQIAGALGIRLRTVNTYRESLARKLGASSAAVITRFVVTTGLTDSMDPAPAR